MIDIHGLPMNSDKYIVARFTDGNYWYWGSYDTEEQAYEAARKIGGQVFTREDK